MDTAKNTALLKLDKLNYFECEDNQKNLEAKALILKERMLKCHIYLDWSYSIDSFNNPERPLL